MKSCPPKNKPPKGECLMGMYRRNVTAAVENKIQEDHPKTGKREKDYLRSLVFLFVIVAIAATVADFRREPVLDGERQDFVILAEAAIEQRKADFWLGGETVEQLMARGTWSTLNDYSRSTAEDAAQKLLGVPATLYDWNILKLEAADRIWQEWNALEAKHEAEPYLADAAAALAAEQQLPGLESSLWLAVTADGERYILAATDTLWAVCPAEDLR